MLVKVGILLDQHEVGSRPQNRPTFEVRLVDHAEWEHRFQLGERQFELNTVPPTYAPPRPPPTGKPLTNRQKLALVATILVIISVLALLVWLAQHRL